MFSKGVGVMLVTCCVQLCGRFCFVCGIVCGCVFFDIQACLCGLFVNECVMMCAGVLYVVWGVCVCLVYTNMFVRFVCDLLCDVVCALCDSAWLCVFSCHAIVCLFVIECVMLCALCPHMCLCLCVCVLSVIQWCLCAFGCD